MDFAHLTQLVSLAAAASRAAQAQMSALRTEEARLREQLDDLMQARHSQSVTAREVGEAAFTAGADIRWHRWIDSRAMQLNLELAQNRAAQARAKDTLQRLLGREQALDKLLTKAKTAARIDAARRAQWMS